MVELTRTTECVVCESPRGCCTAAVAAAPSKPFWQKIKTSGVIKKCAYVVSLSSLPSRNQFPLDGGSAKTTTAASAGRRNEDILRVLPLQQKSKGCSGSGNFTTVGKLSRRLSLLPEVLKLPRPVSSPSFKQLLV